MRQLWCSLDVHLHISKAGLRSMPDSFLFQFFIEIFLLLVELLQLSGTFYSSIVIARGLYFFPFRIVIAPPIKLISFGINRPSNPFLIFVKYLKFELFPGKSNDVRKKCCFWQCLKGRQWK